MWKGMFTEKTVTERFIEVMLDVFKEINARKNHAYAEGIEYKEVK